MHSGGCKQKMGSVNKFSAFPMLHCWMTPAHPPLLQTNPLIEESHLPSQQHCFTVIAVHLQTARTWHMPRATQHRQAPFCSSAFKCLIRMQVRKAKAGHEFWMQNFGLLYQLKTFILHNTCAPFPLHLQDAHKGYTMSQITHLIQF